jgi:hypothetical protein
MTTRDLAPLLSAWIAATVLADKMMEPRLMEVALKVELTFWGKSKNVGSPA